MGKLKGLLDKVQQKVGELNSLRDWQYLPIYHWIFTKFNFSQPEQAEHTNSPQFDNLNETSPIDQDTLQINNDEHDFDYEDQSVGKYGIGRQRGRLN